MTFGEHVQQAAEAAQAETDRQERLARERAEFDRENQRAERERHQALKREYGQPMAGPLMLNDDGSPVDHRNSHSKSIAYSEPGEAKPVAQPLKPSGVFSTDAQGKRIWIEIPR